MKTLGRLNLAHALHLEGLNLWQLVSMDMLLLPSAVQRDCRQFEAKFNCLSIILPRAFCAMEHAFTSGLFPDHPLVFNRRHYRRRWAISIWT